MDEMLNGLFNFTFSQYNDKIAPDKWKIKTGTQPWRDVVNITSQGMHIGALGGRIKPVIRNRIQSLLDWTLLGERAYVSGRKMYHTDKGREILNQSLDFKTRSFIIGQEASEVKKVFAGLGSGFRWADRKNVGQSILSSYMRHIQTGMAEKDTLPSGTKYSKEALKLAELYYKDTQWSYFREDMPKAFWSSSGRFVFGLTSWPMNFFNRYVPEMARRTFRGVDGRGRPVKGTERLAAARFLLLVGAMVALKHGSRVLFDGKKEIDYTHAVLPSPKFLMHEGWSPSMQFVYGVWMATTSNTSQEKAHGLYLMKNAGAIHIPGYLGAKDIIQLLSGQRDPEDYAFYTRLTKKGKAEKKRRNSGSPFSGVQSSRSSPFGGGDGGRSPFRRSAPSGQSPFGRQN